MSEFDDFERKRIEEERRRAVGNIILDCLGKSPSLQRWVQTQERAVANHKQSILPLIEPEDHPPLRWETILSEVAESDPDLANSVREYFNQLKK